MKLPTFKCSYEPLETALNELARAIETVANRKFHAGGDLTFHSDDLGTVVDGYEGSGGGSSESSYPMQISVSSKKVGETTTYEYSVAPATVGGISPKIGGFYLWEHPLVSGARTECPTASFALPAEDVILNIFLKCTVTAGKVTSATFETELSTVSPSAKVNTTGTAYQKIGYIDHLGSTYNYVKTSLAYIASVHVFPTAEVPLTHTFYAL